MAEFKLTWTRAEVEAWSLLRAAGEIPFTFAGRGIDYQRAGDRIVALAERIKAERETERGESSG